MMMMMMRRCSVILGAVTLAILGLDLTSGPVHAAAPPISNDRYAITPEEHAACDGDAVRLCASTYPDETKLLACMRDARPQLTPVCLSVFDAGLKRRHLHL